MCDELGDESYMEDYVLGASGITLCDVATGGGCSDREKEFAQKYAGKPVSELNTQLERLDAMSTKKMTRDLTKWMKQRKAILKSLIRNAHEEL